MNILITIRECKIEKNDLLYAQDVPWEMNREIMIKSGDYIISDEQLIQETITILVKADELIPLNSTDIILSTRTGMYLQPDKSWREAMIGDGDVIQIIHLNDE